MLRYIKDQLFFSSSYFDVHGGEGGDDGVCVFFFFSSFSFAAVKLSTSYVFLHVVTLLCWNFPSITLKSARLVERYCLHFCFVLFCFFAPSPHVIVCFLSLN